VHMGYSISEDASVICCARAPTVVQAYEHELYGYYRDLCMCYIGLLRLHPCSILPTVS